MAQQSTRTPTDTLRARPLVSLGLLLVTFVVPTSSPAAEATSMHEHEVTHVLHWLDGNYTGEKRSAECIAIQAKMLKGIAALKISPEWQAVADTDAYKNVVAAHDSLSSAHCHQASAGTPTDACIALTDKLNEEADVLAATSAWKNLVDSSAKKKFFNEVTKGEKLGCIKTTDTPQGKK